MKIHEYQAKSLLKKYNIPIQDGVTIDSLSEAEGAINEVTEEKNNTVIFEAKEMANPHPNTGINKLRDSIRKAKPSVKTKFQQLTSSQEK